LGGIGVIVNPRSRKNRDAPERMARLGYIAGTLSHYVETATLDDLTVAAHDFKKRGIDILAIGGGDGTNQVTLTHFVRVYGNTPLPMIAFLRGGTMNTTARSFGVKGSSAAILTRIVNNHRRGERFFCVRRRMLEVDGQYGFIFGNGVIANFLDAYYAGRNPGPLRALGLVVRGCTSNLIGLPFARKLFSSVEATVTVDGTDWPTDHYIAIGASTVDQIGLGFRPLFRAADGQDEFHIAGFHCSGGKLIQQLPRIFFGRKPLGSGIEETLAHTATIQSPTSFAYTIDGEMYRSDRAVTLRTGPPVRIILG